jgi:hypothetical protein
MTPTPKTKNTFPELIDLKRHSDHKVVGLTYILVFATTLWYILTDIQYYETNFFLHILTPLVGSFVSMSALRNFQFLSKKAENPGMFAKNRTFSYAFLKENLWFQIQLGATMMFAHPLSGQYIPNWFQIFFIFFMFYYREFVPKTSYTSWEVGNEKVNARSNGWVTFINFQVKIVRWNYVIKKTLLFYLFALAQAEWLFELPQNTYITQPDRWIFYLLCLDAAHNITTTFFLQTLKFKGFISAETFSFLFNVSPIFGLFLTLKLFSQHTFVVPYALAVLVELYINLEFIYPSKKLSFEWKNRSVLFSKAVLVFLATCYLSYVHTGSWVPLSA